MDTQTDFDDVEDGEIVGETKAERFRRIANPRAKAAVKRLRLLRQMVEGANASNYEFTDAQRATLIAALNKEVDEINALMLKRLVRDDGDDVLFV